MKNMKKFITLCGFLILGSIACGDADVVKAEAINNQTTDTSGYTITIPSEVSIDKNSGKGSFAVSGKAEAQVDLNVSVSSKNNYKLKNKSQKISYSLDKESFHIDNVRSANSKSFNEDFNITLANTNTSFSGSYEDKLVFDITGNKYTYKLDANSLLDGKVEFAGHDYGSFDVYINGQKVADDVSNFEKVYPYGTEYEFKDLKGTVGHHYSGVGTYGPHWKETPLKGKLGIDAMYYKTDDSPYLLITPCYFKFDTNKLTINYHADGAQTWYHFDGVTHDVSGKDIAASETYLFGSYYDKKSGLGDVSRLAKKRYTAKPNTWVVGKNGTKEVIDTTGLAKSQDVAEYCGVLDEFKKNDTTIDLYPIWTPNTYTLTYDLNGGSFNASTTQRFKYESEDAISSEIPIKTGYVFTGWKWGDVTMQPGDTIPKECGNFTLTAQWKEIYSMGTILNIDGIEYMVIERQENGNYLVMTTKSIGKNKFGSYFRQDRWNRNCYENSEIDDYLENTWYKGLSTKMQNAIQSTEIRQVSYSDNKLDAEEENGYYYQVYNTISRHVFLPSIKDMAKVVDLSNGTAVQNFLNGEIAVLSRDGHKNYENVVMTVCYDSNHIYTARTEDSVNTRPAFVIDLSKIDYTVTGSVNYKYSKGTTVNIAGSEYIIMDELNGDEYLVISKNTIGNRKFQSDNRLDGQCRSTYEGSAIDNYLENEWYNCLSSTMKAAIQTVNIKQASYATDTNPDSKQETGYNGQVYNTISRQAFLPSVSEIGKAVDLKNPDKVKAFLNGISIWTRDSYQGHANGAEFLLTSTGHLGASYVFYTRGVRPAFVINLS